MGTIRWTYSDPSNTSLQLDAGANTNGSLTIPDPLNVNGKRYSFQGAKSSRSGYDYTMNNLSTSRTWSNSLTTILYVVGWFSFQEYIWELKRISTKITISSETTVNRSLSSVTASYIGWQEVQFSLPGTVEIYTTGNADTYGYLTNGSWSYNSQTNLGSKVLTGNGIFTQNDDSGSGNNFKITYDVAANTTYEIVTVGYDNTTNISGSTLYIKFTPYTYYYRAYNITTGAYLTSSTSTTSTSATRPTVSNTSTTAYTYRGYKRNTSWNNCINMSSYTSTSTTGTFTTAQRYIVFCYSSAPVKYNVTFNANGGSGAPSSVSADANTNATIPSGTPSRTNYIFSGWHTSSTAKQPNYYPGKTINVGTSNKTLYAVWRPKFTWSNKNAAEANTLMSYIYTYLYTGSGSQPANISANTLYLASQFNNFRTALNNCGLTNLSSLGGLPAAATAGTTLITNADMQKLATIYNSGKKY